jgi:hypothetical protein
MSTSKSVQTGATAVVPHEASKSLWSWDPVSEMERMLHSTAMIPSLGMSCLFITHIREVLVIVEF